MNKQTILGWTFVYLVVINVLDFITTRMMIMNQGYNIEANILLLKQMQYVDSTYPILIAKMIPLVLLGFGLLMMIKKQPQHITKMIITVCTINLGLTAIVGASTYCLIG
jgi:hypothetical protein